VTATSTARPRWTRILHSVPPGRRKWAIVALIGWWLSPLTAWNDVFTNIPLSIGAVFLLRALGVPVEPWITAVVVYVLTNILGLAMLWVGMGKVFRERPGPPPRRWLPRMLLRLALYAVMVFLTAWALQSMLQSI
jgi:hypothetical protein